MEADYFDELEPWFEEQKQKMFLADLLDRDNQLLSSGQAIVESDSSAVVFWLRSQWPADKNPASATTLRKSSGELVKLRSLAKCDCPGSSRTHFHFDL